MRRLLLIGGGHAHAVAVRDFLQRPLPDCLVTLVSPSARHTYSGMVPGLVSAHYTRAQAEGDWLWRVKDWIDRRWMEGFAV